MYLKDKSLLDRDIDHENTVFKNIRKKFKKAYSYVSEDGMKDDAFEDIATAQRFLHGNGLPFNTERLIIKDYYITDDMVGV